MGYDIQIEDGGFMTVNGQQVQFKNENGILKGKITVEKPLVISAGDVRIDGEHVQNLSPAEWGLVRSVNQVSIDGGKLFIGGEEAKASRYGNVVSGVISGCLFTGSAGAFYLDGSGFIGSVPYEAFKAWRDALDEKA